MGNFSSRCEFFPLWNELKFNNKTYYSLEEIKKDIIDYYESINKFIRFPRGVKFVLPNILEINYRKGNENLSASREGLNYHYYDIEYLNDYHETITEEYRIVEIS